jgi:hypothetical protein
MFMPNRCDHYRSQSALLQIPARLRPPNSPASPGGGMIGDCSEFMSRAAGEQNPDLFRHASNQLAVFFAPSLFGATRHTIEATNNAVYL